MVQVSCIIIYSTGLKLLPPEIQSGSRTHCRLVLNQARGSHSRCNVMALDIFGGRPDAPPPLRGWRWLLRLRAAGSVSPVPCSSPNMAAGSGILANGANSSLPLGRQPPLLDPGPRQRAFRPHLFFYCFNTTASGRHWWSPLFLLLPDLLSTAIPLSSEGSLTECPSFLLDFGTNLTQFVDREEGGGNRRTFKIL